MQLQMPDPIRLSAASDPRGRARRSCSRCPMPAAPIRTGLLAAARLSRARLETLEDRLVDRLVWRAVEAGAVALIADAPRAEIDLNRDERELDPAMVAAAAAGRQPGPIAPHPRRPRPDPGADRRLGRDLARSASPRAEVARRIERIHRPYHAALGGGAGGGARRASESPSCSTATRCRRAAPAAEAPVVLGDRHGGSMARTCSPPRTRRRAPPASASPATRLMPAATSPSATAARGSGIHALQIELDRSLYLDPDLRTPGPGFAGLARLIAGVAQAIEERLLDSDLAIARIAAQAAERQKK